MRYEDIYINDFGIFANTKLIDLNPNFNIIGGGNRAGKTTFLKLLRYIGYGIPNTDSVPPARHSYDLEAILSDEKSRYSLSIDGYARPKINDLNNEQKDLDEIFSGVDQFTYNQLFTITLEELKKIPSGVSDTEKLQSVLMGAGLKEYTLIPQLKEYFKGNAKDIAGKYGKISVGSFKQYNQIIEEGIELKEEAQRQVNEYYNLKEEFKTAKEKIDEKVEKKDMLRKEKNKLDLIKSNYKRIEELIQLENEIDKDKYLQISNEQKKLYPERAEELFESYKKQDNKFKEILEDYKELTDKEYKYKEETLLLQYSDKIDSYYNKISGLEERKNNIISKDKELNDKYSSIKKEAALISDYLSNNLEELLEIETSLENKNKLRALVKDFEEITTKMEEKKEQIDALKREIESKENKIKDFKGDNNLNTKKGYLYSAIAGILLITYLTFLNWRFVGLYLIDIYLFYRYYRSYIKREEIINQKEELEEKIEDLEREKIYLSDELDELFNKKEKLREELKDIKESIHLSGNIQPKLLKDYYQDVLNLKNIYLEYITMRKGFKKRKEEYQVELRKIYNFLKQFKNLINNENINEDNILDNIDIIINNIKKLYKIKDLMQKIKNARLSKEEVKEQLLDLEGMDLIEKENRGLYIIVEDYKEKAELIESFVSKKERAKEIRDQLSNITEQTKNAFDINKDISKAETVTLFIKEFENYISYKQVEDKYNLKESELDKIINELENLRSKKQKIKINMGNLATEEKLIKAENKINKARNNMKPLAERYAVNNMASYILNRYWQKFLKEKKDKLLNKASEIMEQITSGEYSKIEPLESLTDPNFKVHSNDGKIFENIEYLSRGTREQLFMAIRINRIMEINPPLPVIIDDSLVNFDPIHLRNIFDIINNLKDRNQIFFLTCHPEQIEFLDEKIDKKNYYSLSKGRFEKTNKIKLIKSLN